MPHVLQDAVISAKSVGLIIPSSVPDKIIIQTPGLRKSIKSVYEMAEKSFKLAAAYPECQDYVNDYFMPKQDWNSIISIRDTIDNMGDWVSKLGQRYDLDNKVLYRNCKAYFEQIARDAQIAKLSDSGKMDSGAKAMLPRDVKTGLNSITSGLSRFGLMGKKANETPLLANAVTSKAPHEPLSNTTGRSVFKPQLDAILARYPATAKDPTDQQRREVALSIHSFYEGAGTWFLVCEMKAAHLDWNVPELKYLLSSVSLKKLVEAIEHDDIDAHTELGFFNKINQLKSYIPTASGLNANKMSTVLEALSSQLRGGTKLSAAGAQSLLLKKMERFTGEHKEAMDALVHDVLEYTNHKLSPNSKMTF